MTSPAFPSSRAGRGAGRRSCTITIVNICLQAHWRAFDAHEPFRLKYRMRRHDGEYRWVIDHGSPRFDERGAFAGFTGACVDITELQETAEALRQSEERFRMFGRATNDAIRDWDFATNLVWWNEGLQTLFGYPTDETTGKAEWWQRHIHPDDRERIASGHRARHSARTLLVRRISLPARGRHLRLRLRSRLRRPRRQRQTGQLDRRDARHHRAQGSGAGAA